jgi:hypothetical protein
LCCSSIFLHCRTTKLERVCLYPTGGEQGVGDAAAS